MSAPARTRSCYSQWSETAAHVTVARLVTMWFPPLQLCGSIPGFNMSQLIHEMVLAILCIYLTHAPGSCKTVSTSGFGCIMCLYPPSFCSVTALSILRIYNIDCVLIVFQLCNYRIFCWHMSYKVNPRELSDALTVDADCLRTNYCSFPIHTPFTYTPLARVARARNIPLIIIDH